MSETNPGTATVLLVDDDDFVRRLLQVIMKRRGYAVVEAINGEEGLAKLVDGGIDLVLLDYNMPGLSGTDTCRLIRERHDDLPVLFITGAGDPAALEAGRECGANGLVTKPFDEEDLAARIAALLPA